MKDRRYAKNNSHWTEQELVKNYPPFDFESRKPAHNFIDLTDKEVGRLTVLYRFYENSKDRKSQWVCLCDCGNYTIVPSNRLKGNTNSCGCLYHDSRAEININRQTHFISVGDEFGLLTVLEDLGLMKLNGSTKQRTHYRVRCSCGQEFITQKWYLLSGDTKSCGHLKSWGEEFLKNKLIENNISFIREKTFQDLIGDERPLRFDFEIYINNKAILIEYQGTQHYDESSLWYSERGQKYDLMKREYAKENNIRLYLLYSIADIINFIETIKEEIK